MSRYRRHGHQRRDDGGRSTDGNARLSDRDVDRRGPMNELDGGRHCAGAVRDRPAAGEVLSAMISRAYSAETRRWRRSRLSIGNLFGRVKELGIDCGADARPSLYPRRQCARAGRALQDEARQRGVGRASVRPRSATAGHSRKALRHRARRSDPQPTPYLTPDPRKLAAGLLLKALGRRARFYAPVRGGCDRRRQETRLVDRESAGADDHRRSCRCSGDRPRTDRDRVPAGKALHHLSNT